MVATGQLAVDQVIRGINVADPRVFIGLLIGGAVPILFNGQVYVGTLDGAADTACDRCGQPSHFAASGDVDCVYVPVDEVVERGEDAEPPADDAPDEGEYDGVSLDLVHVVREFFALERPARLLCADVDPAADAACLQRFRALANLGPPEPDPRFSVLKGVKPTR
jgi:uncharacterized metal-binding protein YceD (DUF177 family)